jgi:hypothetical protein
MLAVFLDGPKAFTTEEFVSLPSSLSIAHNDGAIRYYYVMGRVGHFAFYAIDVSDEDHLLNCIRMLVFTKRKKKREIREAWPNVPQVNMPTVREGNRRRPLHTAPMPSQAMPQNSWFTMAQEMATTPRVGGAAVFDNYPTYTGPRGEGPHRG